MIFQSIENKKSLQLQIELVWVDKIAFKKKSLEHEVKIPQMSKIF